MTRAGVVTDRGTTVPSTRPGSSPLLRLALWMREIGVRRGVAAALVLAPAAAFALLVYRVAGAGDPVLVVARPVAVGQVIGRGDLRVGEMKGNGITSVANLDDVVGKRASQALTPGELLSPSDVADALPLAPTEAAIGLTLEPDQAVAGLIARGEHVVVVGQVRDSTGGTAPVEVGARVVDVARAKGSGDRLVVTLAVGDASEASRIAAAEEAGRVRLVVVGGR